MRIRESRRKKSIKKFFVGVFLFLAVGTAGFFAAKHFIENAEVSRESMAVIDETLSGTEHKFIEGIVGEDKFALPIKISAITSAEKTDFAFSELVPVTDWYSLETSVSSADIKNGPTNCISEALGDVAIYATSGDCSIYFTLVSPDALNGTKKLLSLNGHYYLDDPKTGAVYRTLTFEIDESGVEKVDDKRRSAASDDLAALKNKFKGNLPDLSHAEDQILTFAQTGVTALSRMMVTRLKQVGNGDYPAANIEDFLSSHDLTHISNEVSFANNCPGGSDTVVLCSDWRFLDAITAIGTDIIELTGNHNNDYGAQANLDTIAKYEELGLKTFGGGKNEESAKIPLEINQKNAKIALIGVNNSTTTAAYGGATGNVPGANLYNEATVKSQIEEAKAKGNFVIVDIQYFECYSYPEGGTEMPSCDYPISGQQNFFRKMIEFGADMVVGTQAHQPQTFELYQGKPIYYGLGNLFFDQTYWPGTTRGYILTHYFRNGTYIQTKLTPHVYDTTYQTRLMDESSANSFLSRLLKASPRGE